MKPVSKHAAAVRASKHAVAVRASKHAAAVETRHGGRHRANAGLDAALAVCSIVGAVAVVGGFALVIAESGGGPNQLAADLPPAGTITVVGGQHELPTTPDARDNLNPGGAGAAGAGSTGQVSATASGAPSRSAPGTSTRSGRSLLRPTPDSGHGLFGVPYAPATSSPLTAYRSPAALTTVTGPLGVSTNTSRPSPPPSASATSRPTISTPPITQPPPLATGGFDPVTFNWASVGGPASGLTNAGTGGGLTLNAAGKILTGVQTMVGAQAIAQATGSGLENCNVKDTFRANGNGVSLRHCTVGNGVTGAGSYTLAYNFITSQGDGIDPTGAGYKLIQYNKIWRDGTRVGTSHEDGIQFWQGGNALISRNWISGWQTSAIMVKADLGPISNVTIDSNFLDNPTGYYQLYLCSAAHGLTNVTVTNNAFGKASSTVSTCGGKVTFVHTEAQRQAAIAAGDKAAAAWVVWNNNYIAGTKTVIVPPGGWAR